MCVADDFYEYWWFWGYLVGETIEWPEFENTAVHKKGSNFTLLTIIWSLLLNEVGTRALESSEILPNFMVETWYDYDFDNERSVNGNGWNFLPSIPAEVILLYFLEKFSCPVMATRKRHPQTISSIKNEFNLIEKTRRTTRTEDVVSRNLINFLWLVSSCAGKCFFAFLWFRCRRARQHRQQCRVFINFKLVLLGTFWKQSLSPTINWNISFINSFLNLFTFSALRWWKFDSQQVA